MNTVAVLPVKTFARAKQRLEDAVGVVEREQLAQAMAADVLDALLQVSEIASVIVVTAEPHAADAARAAGATVVDDPDEAGQSPAAILGMRAAVQGGAERVLLVPGDCPALDPAELGALLEPPSPAAVVIVPDRHGSGTNALLLTPPEVMLPSFGAGSFARHAARARAAGTSVHVARLASLELDVDTPEDLGALRAALSAGDAGAARTRTMLGREPAAGAA